MWLCSQGSGLEHRLQLDLDPDLAGDQQAAAVQRHVPAEPQSSRSRVPDALNTARCPHGSRRAWPVCRAAIRERLSALTPGQCRELARLLARVNGAGEAPLPG
jgi:hypothetical protein